VTNAARVVQTWRVKLISTDTKSNTITPTIKIKYVAPNTQ